MGYLEELFPLFILNSMLITYFLNRKYSLFNKFFKTVGKNYNMFVIYLLINNLYISYNLLY